MPVMDSYSSILPTAGLHFPRGWFGKHNIPKRSRMSSTVFHLLSPLLRLQAPLSAPRCSSIWILVIEWIRRPRTCFSIETQRIYWEGREVEDIGFGSEVTFGYYIIMLLFPKCACLLVEGILFDNWSFCVGRDNRLSIPSFHPTFHPVSCTKRVSNKT